MRLLHKTGKGLTKAQIEKAKKAKSENKSKVNKPDADKQ